MSSPEKISEMPSATSAQTMPTDRPMITRSMKKSTITPPRALSPLVPVPSGDKLQRRTQFLALDSRLRGNERLAATSQLRLAVGNRAAEIRQADIVVVDHLVGWPLDGDDAVL